MFTELFHVEGPWPGSLSISSRPRGGDWLVEEICAWRRLGIDVVVSLLEPAEAIVLELTEEERCCRSNGIRFVSFPIADRDVPSSSEELQKLLIDLDNDLSKGRNVVVHCRQGVGRAGLVATALLLERGVDPKAAMMRVTSARGVSIPETSIQRSWIESFVASPARAD